MTNDSIRHISLQELAFRISRSQNRSPAPPGNRFALFMGAGASIESGIPGTKMMIEGFHEELRKLWQAENASDTYERWLRSRHSWDDGASEYSNLFVALEPTSRGRSAYIENLVSRATPSFGYFCLSQLLGREYFDVVLTTNFDDLVYESCASGTGIRPRVYAYGSPSGPVRWGNGRPAVLKPHGDFFYSSLKNTRPSLVLSQPNCWQDRGGAF